MQVQSRRPLIFNFSQTLNSQFPTDQPKQLSEKRDGKNRVDSLATHKQNRVHADCHILNPQTELHINSNINPDGDPQTQV